MISDKLQPFGTTIFSEMTALALEESAINLSQGFPDFDGPDLLIEAAVDALRGGVNQYSRSRGLPALTEALVERRERDGHGAYDPESEVCVFTGATEAIAATLIGLLNPGDEVVLFEPFYDSYPASLAMAGAKARYVTLKFPDYRLDLSELEAAIGPRTRAILLNTPHNPTGKVFDDEELEAVAALCRKHDLVVVSDEVYERLTFDGLRHRSIATLPGMRERTLVISSAGKTYSFTGWKIGWALGPPALVDAAAAAHQFLTFCCATPLQAAVAAGLKGLGVEQDEQFREEYTQRRDLLARGLRRCGFEVPDPQGTYFILADFSGIEKDMDDRSFAVDLCRKKKVATVPPSVFYAKAPEEGRHLLRFAFCKKLSTLEDALRRIEGDPRS